MSDIPHYFLYGEAAPSGILHELHIATLQESLPKHNWAIHPHRHDILHQLLMVEQGSVLAQINERCREERGPCILSIPPREVHGFVHQHNVKGYIITITQSFLLNLFTETERETFNHLLRTPFIARPQPDSQTAWTLENIAPALLREYQASGTGQSAMIGAYLKILFVLLHRCLGDEQTAISPNDSAQDARIKSYEQFIALMEDSYRHHWPVDRYADTLGLTSSQLNRLCQHYSGQNALQIIHERLITEAKRQLIYTQLSAKEIGYKLGFKDPGYFSRFFSRKCGLTPVRFKKQIREQRQQN